MKTLFEVLTQGLEKPMQSPPRDFNQSFQISPALRFLANIRVLWSASSVMVSRAAIKFHLITNFTSRLKLTVSLKYRIHVQYADKRALSVDKASLWPVGHSNINPQLLPYYNSRFQSALPLGPSLHSNVYLYIYIYIDIDISP